MCVFPLPGQGGSSYKQNRQNYMTTGKGVGHSRVHHPTKWAAFLQSGPQKLLRRTGIMCVCVCGRIHLKTLSGPDIPATNMVPELPDLYL